MIALEMIGITTLRLVVRITLTRQCPGFTRSGRLYCRGRQNAGYQRRSQVKAALLSSRDLSVYSMNAPGLFPALISLTILIIGNTIFRRNDYRHRFLS